MAAKKTEAQKAQDADRKARADRRADLHQRYGTTPGRKGERAGSSYPRG